MFYGFIGVRGRCLHIDWKLAGPRELEAFKFCYASESFGGPGARFERAQNLNIPVLLISSLSLE